MYHRGQRGSRKRKQTGGFLVEASGAALVMSAGLTLARTLAAVAARYGLHAIERKLKGPEADTWLRRVLYWIPKTLLSAYLMGDQTDTSMGIIGVSALMYADKYLNKQLKQEQTETAEGAKRLKMAQDATDALEAKVQEDARNAVMKKPKQKTVDADQPATQPATKQKIIKAKRATKPKAAEHTNSRRGKEKGAKRGD